MVSIFTMVMMAVCVLIGIAVPAFFILVIRRRSSKIEAGLSGAVGYGFIGYIWQYVFLMFFTVFISKLPVPGSAGFQVVVINVLLTFVSTACTGASLYWGIYLTNQKQISLYRSVAVGIGFSLGRIGIELVYTYVYKLYLSIQINAGTCQADEIVQQFVKSTTVGSLISGTYKCLIMFVIIFTIALIMGNYYIQKRWKMACLSVFVIYEAIMLISVALSYMPFGDILFMVAATVIAAAGGVILYHWFRYGEVEMNPLAVIRKRGSGAQGHTFSL